MQKTLTGPFAGTLVALTSLIQTADGQALLWPLADRYPLFRGKYPADQGWSLTTSNAAIAGEFPAYDETGFPYRNNQGDILLFPARLITARLTDPSGRVVADASTLVELGTRKAYEAGENNARSRLFESLGLPAAFSPTDFQARTQGAAKAELSVVPRAVPIQVPQVSVPPSLGPGHAPPVPVMAVPSSVPSNTAGKAQNAPPAIEPHGSSAPAADDEVVITEVEGPAVSMAVTPPPAAQQATPVIRTLSGTGISPGLLARAKQAAARAGKAFDASEHPSNEALLEFMESLQVEAAEAAKAEKRNLRKASSGDAS